MPSHFKNPLKPLLEEYQSINKVTFFSLVCILAFMLLFLKKNLIELELAAFEILEERGEMSFIHMINALQYFSIPLIYLFKFTVTAFIIWMGSFTWGYKVSYRSIWHLVMLGECIFFLAEAVKIAWFLLAKNEPEFWDIKAFYPASLMNFFNYRELADKLHYPLKALNLFEIVYWAFLSLGIQYQSKKRMDVSLYIILSFYVFWFLLWLGFYILVYK